MLSLEQLYIDDTNDNNDNDNDTNDDDNDTRWKNHDCIGSLACSQMSQKRRPYLMEGLNLSLSISVKPQFLT